MIGYKFFNNPILKILNSSGSFNKYIILSISMINKDIEYKKELILER